MPGIDIGIDLGTSTVQIATKDRGVVLDEPAIVAVDTDIEEIIAYGLEAYKMVGRTSERVVPVYPLNNGVISNYELAEEMLTAFVEQVCGNKVFMPRVVVCVPINITEVERLAVSDSLHTAGARRVYLIEEAVAAALGAGIDISKPQGRMIIDIGGGTTDIAVMSLNGMASSKSTKTASRTFDEAIIKHMRTKHDLLIGPKMAEKTKIAAGCAVNLEEPLTARVSGRSLSNGLPRFVEVTSDELCEAMREPIMEIVECVKDVLESTPPELVSDIIENGVIMTGGGSQLRGIDTIISNLAKINVRVAENPGHCVANGTALSLKFMDNMTEEEIMSSPLEVYTF